MGRILSLTAVAAIFVAVGAGAAQSQSSPQVADVSHTDPVTARFFDGLFTAKSGKDVDGTMVHFSPDLLTYGDATLGVNFSGFGELRAVFAKYMPSWGAGLSYPVRIVGGPNSAVVAFTGTSELWGAEFHILGAVDLKDGKIVRWVDYFDSTPHDLAKFEKIKTPQAQFPTSFREANVGDNASVRIRDVATRFQKALALSDAKGLSELLTRDAVYEDMALHAQLVGKTSIEAYFSRILASAPFGAGATLRHVVGGNNGGGFEWIGGGDMKNVVGITALELDPVGKVSRVTTSYDGRQLGLEKAKSLAVLILQP